MRTEARDIEKKAGWLGSALRRLACASMLGAMLAAGSVGAASAETRTLKLYYIHTKERAEITYKRNGKYLSSGLNKINRFLRDWRRNEPTKMDPALLDLVWEAYRATGARDYIHVVSAYRSPATNDMLRKTRGGQAKKSQHMLGKAMDFYIPGVKLSKLREIGFKIGGGGVGYYPKSGVPFVHFDTGNVRAWPRMSRPELVRLFPNGKTLHLPPDGKPLPGYQQALAEYKSRQRSGKAPTLQENERRGGGNLLAAIFGGGADDEEDSAESSAPAVASAPARRSEPAAPAAPAAAPSAGTLIASLPARDLPVPTIAPRSNSAGVPVVIPAEPVATAAPEPVAVAAAPQVPAFEPPIPSQRPAVLVARAEAPIDRRSAAELEAALSAANGEAGEVVAAAAPAAEPADNGADAIARAIEGGTDRPAEPALAYVPPIPQPAPERPNRAAEVQVASIPAPETRPAAASDTGTAVAYVPPVRGLPAETASAAIQPAATAAPAPAGKSGRVLTASLEPDQTATASFETGVATTRKGAKPTEADIAAVAQAPRPAIIPAEQIDQSRFGEWVTTAELLTTQGRASERPDFVQNAVRAAPEVVYAQGFSKAPPPDANSFTGNAVTFLAVARFAGGTGSGGDGEPLQLTIPN